MSSSTDSHTVLRVLLFRDPQGLQLLIIFGEIAFWVGFAPQELSI